MVHTISTVGDKTSHGGRILTGSDTRLVQGRRVARLGDMCSCPIHGRSRISEVMNIMPETDGLPTCHSDAKTACGAKILISEHTDLQGPVGG